MRKIANFTFTRLFSPGADNAKEFAQIAGYMAFHSKCAHTYIGISRNICERSQFIVIINCGQNSKINWEL